MEDMWKKEGRVKPVPLSYEAIMDGTFTVPPLRTAPAPPAPQPQAQANGVVNGNAPPSEKVDAANAVASSSTAPAAAPASGAANGQTARRLKDQKELSVKENLELFVDRLVFNANSCDVVGLRPVADASRLERSLTPILFSSLTRMTTIRSTLCLPRQTSVRLRMVYPTRPVSRSNVSWKRVKRNTADM